MALYFLNIVQIMKQEGGGGGGEKGILLVYELAQY